MIKVIKIGSFIYKNTCWWEMVSGLLVPTCHACYLFSSLYVRNKRKIMRIFTLPPAAEMPTEPNFYDSMKKIRLRQQLEMYSIGKFMLCPLEMCIFLSNHGNCITVSFSSTGNAWIF